MLGTHLQLREKYSSAMAVYKWGQHQLAKMKLNQSKVEVGVPSKMYSRNLTINRVSVRSFVSWSLRLPTS
jgi:hypothetical protein